jgi:hypothetical protein
MSPRPASPDRQPSMTDLVVAALQDAERPLKLDELVEEVRKRGYVAPVEYKNPAQLRASISALAYKSTRIRRVGRATYSLSRY